MFARGEYNNDMARKSPTIGLALGSGGAKGLAHIGVLRSFEKHHIPINFIAGSSIGAIIGAHYARFQDSKKIEEIILAFSRKKGMGLVDWTISGGIVKGIKTEKFITEILEGAQFTDLRIPFAAVATDINTATPAIFTSGNLVKAIRASTSIPAIYQPIFHEKKLLADAALSNPVPVDIVKQMGSDITTGVNLDTVYSEQPLTSLPPLSKMPTRAIHILQHNLALHAVKTADIVISPKNVWGIGILGWNFFFDNEKARKIMQAGEEAADTMMPQIRERIEAFKKEQSVVKRMLRILSGKY